MSGHGNERGKAMRGRKQQLVNIPGTYRASVYGSVYGEGMNELTAEKIEPDVLCIIPKRKNRVIRKLVMTLGTAGIVGGVAAAIILAAPAFGVFFFALLAWVLFAGWAMGEM